MKLPNGTVVEFRKATGKAEQLNIRVQKLVFIAVEHFKWPKKIIIGRDLIDFPEEYIKSFWLGDFGINAEVGFIDGRRVMVIC